MSVFPLLIKSTKSLFVLIAVMLAATAVAQQNAAPGSNVSDRSASIIVVLDNSKEARGNFNTLRNAARDFVQQFGTKDEMALYLTSDRPTLAQDFTGDISLVTQKMSKLKAKGKLPLMETIAQALDHARSDSANDRIAVVAFVSDLDSSTGARAAELESKIREKAGVQLYVVSYGKHDWQSQEMAQRLAVLSGGAAYFPAKGSEVSSVGQVIAKKLGGSPNTESAENTDALPSLHDYNIVLVHDIPVASNDDTAQLPGGNNLLLHNVLIARLQKSKLFGEVRDASGTDADPAPVATNAGRGGELELLPMIVSYRGGIHGPKDIISPFASPKLRIQVVMRDRSTHEPIGAFTEEASGSSGLLRGSDEKVQAQAMISVSDKIVSRLKQMKKEDRRKR